MEGLSGRVTNVGVNWMLSHRSDQPAWQVSQTRCIQFDSMLSALTGASITDTIRLVRDPPMTPSQIQRAANNSNMQATEAGKDTFRCLNKESTPKHAVRIVRIPTGTKIHDFRVLSREFQKACRPCKSSARTHGRGEARAGKEYTYQSGCDKSINADSQ